MSKSKSWTFEGNIRIIGSMARSTNFSWNIIYIIIIITNEINVTTALIKSSGRNTV